jgi:hypothetical protein
VRENNASCRFDMERISDYVYVGEDCLDSRLIGLGFVCCLWRRLLGFVCCL